MNFDTVHVISKHIEPSPRADVEELESCVGIKLPAVYADFITRFGAGIYCDLFRIYTPKQILKDYTQFRELWDEYYYSDTEGKQRWFFEGNEDILSAAQIQESVIIGDSIDGDHLIFYPPQSDKIYILPRHSQTIVSVHADFSDLHLWERKTPRMLTFAPWHQQTNLYFHSTQYTLTQAICLEQFRLRWGNESILMLDESSDAWSWQLIFYLPPIGGRVQILQDEEVTRIITQENGVRAMIRGGGQRSLDIQIACDGEAEADLRAFFAHLQTQGLVTFLGK